MAVKESIAFWSGGKIGLAAGAAGIAKITLSLGPLWDIEGILIAINVVFGIWSTFYQDHWDFIKVLKDLGRNLMLLTLSGVAYMLSARGVIPSMEAGSPTGDWVATVVVFLLVAQMLHLMQAAGVPFGPLTPWIDRLEAKAAPPLPLPPPENAAAAGSILKP